jgi:hypothetical protein
LQSVFKNVFISLRFHAWMAELVDALVSGTSVRKDVQVRVLFQARLRPESSGYRCVKHDKLSFDESGFRRAKHTDIIAQVVELVDTPA